MAGTYSRIYLQIVFATKGRQSLISKRHLNEVFKYISGIITAKGQKSIIVNGMPDHVHALIGLKPSCLISDLVRDMKNNSSRFINERGLCVGRFAWQEGYGVFLYSQDAIQNVYNYILTQNEHHIKKTIREEYVEFLEEFEIEYNKKYIFK